MMTMFFTRPVSATTNYWCRVKPYADITYDETVGNSALGDWGAVSVGAHIVKYVDWGSSINYDTLLVRFDADAALKDDYRDVVDLPI